MNPTLTNKATPDRTAPPRRERVGFLLALGSAALFSLKGVVVKLALARGVTVETLMVWRMSLALPVYLVIGVRLWHRARGNGAATPRHVYLAAAGLGVLSYYVCTWLDFTGLRYISAQFERMILFTYPTLTAVLAWLLIGERFTRLHAAALVVSYAGVVLVFGAEWQAFGDHAAWGMGLVFAAALLFALYVVYAKAVIQRLGAMLFTCVAMTAATAAIVTHQAVGLRVAGTGLSSVFTAPAITAGAFLALVCTVLPSFMLSEAIHRIGPARTSAAGNVGPVVTTVMAVWILQEPFGVVRAAGLVLILVGVGMIGRNPKPRPASKQTPASS